MKFFRFALWTPFPYMTAVVPLWVLLTGYGWGRAALGLLFSGGIFMSAAWVNYRREDAADTRGVAGVNGAWPSVHALREKGYALGVAATPNGRGQKVLVVAPEGDGPWWYVRDPSRWSRRPPDVVRVAAYEDLIAQLEHENVRYQADSADTRALVDAMVVRLAARGVTRVSIAAGTVSAQTVDSFKIVGPIVGAGPRFGKFDRRVPTPAEAARVTDLGLGLALRRVPRAHRDLDFLQWFPGLRGLWISGRVNPARIEMLTELTQLSLLAAGSDPVDLSRLRDLALYEGELRGRESVLTLPRLKALYLEHVGEGHLDRVPPTLEQLSLLGATQLTSLDVLSSTSGLEELEIQGAHVLDISAIGVLRRLRELRLTEIQQITGATALLELNRLRELHLTSIDTIDLDDIARALPRVDIVISPPNRRTASGSTGRVGP